MKITEKDGWLIDENNNKASVSYFGTKENAEKALKSLTNCKNCTNCSGCRRCSGCSGCSGCRRCSGCSDCSGKEESLDVPKIENIHQAVLTAATKTDESLEMDNWHTCETTHCRAGWIVFLAGKEGKALESKTNTCFAAMMIYKKSSDIRVSPTKFFITNKESISDMERCADLEKSAAQA